MTQPDPRNPQPGQVWERKYPHCPLPVRQTIVKKKCPIGPECRICKPTDVHTLIDNLWPGLCSIRRWRHWACPWWRGRKHWAKCVEWKEDG